MKWAVAGMALVVGCVVRPLDGAGVVGGDLPDADDLTAGPPLDLAGSVDLPRRPLIFPPPPAAVSRQRRRYSPRPIGPRSSPHSPTVSLIWGGNATSGFDVRINCSTPTFCQGQIVASFTALQRAVGIDYPGNVQLAWKRPDGAIIRDTGDVSGSGDNFLGLGSDQPIQSAVLIRNYGNLIRGVSFAACPLRPGQLGCDR